jgi:hypothetical protein
MLLILPFVYIGLIAPTPTWYQYYFALVPFLVVLMLFALSTLPGRPSFEAATLFLCVAGAIAYVYGGAARNGAIARDLLSPESWTPTRVERSAESISAYLNSNAGNAEREVLTLSPLYVILSGTPIYKEFGTGPFAWRVSHLLTETEAADRGLPVAKKISDFVHEHPPRAVLTGQEHSLDLPLVNAAKELGYEPSTAPEGLTVWSSPK